MSSLTIGDLGETALPDEVRSRYGLKPHTPVRIIETRSGILIVPLTGEPMREELARELADWQSLGAAAWDAFVFDDSQE